MQVIHLTIAKTATGYYVEHEADKTVNAYAVAGESWEALNPALQGIETLFTVEKAADTGGKKKSGTAEKG